MKLQFSWYQWPGSGGLMAVCEVPIPGTDKFSQLGSLLMDDGGVSLATTLEIIDHGIASIEAVREGRSPEERWGREYFWSLIRRDGVELTSYFEEIQPEMISLENLERALRAWKKFLKATPVAGLVHEVEV